MDDEKKIRTLHPEFPSNAHNRKIEKAEPTAKKIEKVVNGKVIVRKKTFRKKFIETFIGDDINNVSSYIIHDVLIPAIKSTIADAVKGGIEMMLFGEKQGSRTRRENGRSYVSYNSMSSGRRDDRREMSSQNRARHNFDDIILASRGEAEEVLSNLVDMTEDYGQASVSDLYDLVGITANFTDNKWGWTNLSSASVSRTLRGDGYLLNLPKPILLE